MNILITGAWNCNEDELQIIRNLGHTIVFFQDERADCDFDVKMFDGIICNSFFLYHDITLFINLSYIQTTSAGLDRIPLDYCNNNNIKVFNAKDVYSIPMAEFAISGILDLYKRKQHFFISQSQHKWEKDRNLFELNDKTILILGCGSVGTECAKRIKAFGCTVYGIDIINKESVYFDSIFSLEKLDTILPLADIVLISLPLTDKTKSLFNKQRFGIMKRNSIIVNISRGEIIDSNSLYISVQTGALFGAVLDVFENEPLDVNSPLWSLNNVIITPHNSYASVSNAQRLFKVIIKNLLSAKK